MDRGEKSKLSYLFPKLKVTPNILLKWNEMKFMGTQTFPWCGTPLLLLHHSSPKMQCTSVAMGLDVHVPYQSKAGTPGQGVATGPSWTGTKASDIHESMQETTIAGFSSNSIAHLKHMHQNLAKENASLVSNKGGVVNSCMIKTQGCQGNFNKNTPKNCNK